MKMIQTLYPSVNPWVEVFYDGEARVENNVIEIPKGKEHWYDILLIERGFSPMEPRSRKKVTKDEPHDS